MRESGVLLPISALPSKYGIGSFSREAYEFVDFLADAGQRNWQILPLGQTGYGDSPYQSFSTFAGNPYFIDLEKLVEEGLLYKEECEACDFGSCLTDIDYEKMYFQRYPLLRKAFSRFVPEDDYEVFTKENEDWLENYALYTAIKASQGGISWNQWEAPLRDREEKTLETCRKDLKEELDFVKFMQFYFFKQWKALKAYAGEQGIQIIGDIPIYVAFDSADTWANPQMFQFTEKNEPIAVAGCPPDGFSKTGQLWGNPLYDWEYHKKTGYEWWVRRVQFSFELYDVVRVDHFRGFDAYYAIPYGDKTAEYGHWEEGPGLELFETLKEKLGELRIIAEDLGFLTESVLKLVKDTGYPGMKVLQFAFDSREESDYLPHNYGKNCVVYTGTHDNDTTAGWYESLNSHDRKFASQYMNNEKADREEAVWDLIRLGMSSVADLCITPLQDYLVLGKEARINTPSTLGENWRWRFKKEALTVTLSEKIYNMTKLYGRYKEESEEKKNLRRNRYMEQKLQVAVKDLFGTDIAYCTKEQMYVALLHMTKNMMKDMPKNEGKKKVYYISAEFLIGKLLSNNLINLGIYDQVAQVLKHNGKNLAEIEEIELEPSLGNGGLGRLAACFLDSIATLGLPGDGIGLNYHFGLFQQVFEQNKQTAKKNPWITKESWLTRSDLSFEVPFKDFTLKSVLYNIDVPGYENGVNQLHLFDLDSIDESIVKNGIDFDKEDIAHNLTLFLYPDDSDKKGELLRIYQQYFMVSNGAQLIMKEVKEKGGDLHKLYEYAVIQINDTHPSMVIPELIRLLTQKEGFTMEEAILVVSKTCAYTNHTILAEALEKWPLSYLEQVVPHLIPIIKELDKRIKAKFEDERVYIIDENERVHMAHMDIHYGFSVNGVAALHTEILKESELKHFYDIYPEKFNNKTNGITFRRWLLHCNKELTNYIQTLLGDGFKKDAMELEKLLAFTEDDTVLEKLRTIKKHNKEELKQYLKETQGIEIDENSIFDIQIKRLHEYKRQQMNALYAIYKYLEIKKGNIPSTPITMIFGAKAAPAYIIAQDIIHLILCLQQLIDNDPQVSPYLKVVMVENYNVTKAEKLIPACDISEQISLASKEASGTGNMKFMLNGAVTLGTEDGANVEIHQLVGDNNIYVFGKSSDEVIELYDKAAYHSRAIYESDETIEELVDFIINKELIKIGDPMNLCRLYKELISKDWFMTLLDLKEYIATKEKMLQDYEDEKTWSKKALINIAKAGFFSADRTIAQYNEDIWKL